MVRIDWYEHHCLFSFVLFAQKADAHFIVVSPNWQALSINNKMGILVKNIKRLFSKRFVMSAYFYIPKQIINNNGEKHE